YSIIVNSCPGCVYACKLGRRFSTGTSCFSIKYFRSCVIETVMVFFANDCSPELDLGNSSLTTCGLATAEASRKNNIKKNMMSFNAEVLTSAAGRLLLLLKFIRK